MGVLTLLALAVALGTDAFSLALGMGLSGIRQRKALLFPLIVAIFHVAMPLAGLLVGRISGEYLGHLAKILGGCILVFIGGRILYGVHREPEMRTYSFTEARKAIKAPPNLADSSLVALLLLAAGVSLDALSVGFSLGTVGAQLAGTVLTMGIVAGSMTWLGILLGRTIGGWIGRRAEVLGGIILLLIGIKIMV